MRGFRRVPNRLMFQRVRPAFDFAMHRFVETAFVPFFATLAQAVALVPTGLFVVVMATVFLFQNEAGIGLEDFGRSTATAPADRTDGPQGEAVTVTATVSPSVDVGDPVFFRAPGTALVSRDVQVFAWDEGVSQSSKAQWGGGRETTTVYEYEQRWVSNPMPPEAMRYPDGHENPRAPYASATFVPESFHLGAWRLDPMWVQSLAGSVVQPTDVEWSAVGQRLTYDAEDGWYYLDRSATPTLGDVRVRFVRLRADVEVTAIGVRDGSELAPVEWTEGIALVPLFPGTRAEAIQMLGALDATLLWIFRIGGALAILFGLVLIVSPLFAVLDIIPPVGMVARFGAGVVLIPVALGWSVSVICVSQMLRNPVVLIIVGVLAYGVFRAWWAARKARRDMDAVANAPA